MGWLEEALRSRLASRPAGRTRRPGLRPAAVLIPLVSGASGHDILLTRRASNLRRQPGDISFPGGVIDETDPTPLAAALRECEEEVGLRASDVDVLGQMDERETVTTGFHVIPFVGAVRGPYPFRASHEVAELILVPLHALCDPSVLRVEHRHLRSGRQVPVYHFLHGGYDIWGMTGRLIKDLLDLVPEVQGV